MYNSNRQVITSNLCINYYAYNTVIENNLKIYKCIIKSLDFKLLESVIDIFGRKHIYEGGLNKCNFPGKYNNKGFQF